MNRHTTALGSLALMCLLTGSALATRITFDGAATSNNTDIPKSYGSFIAGNSTGFVTTDGSGATPSIGLAWLGTDEWEYHSATTWTHETPVSVAQMDHNPGLPPTDNVAEVVFTPIDGRSVKINSFLVSVANDSLADHAYDWEVVGTGVSGSLNVPLGGNTGTVPVNFTGASGVPYTLRLTYIPGDGSGSGGALDDLSFSEVLLPGAEVLRLFVDRLTGGISLKNVGASSVNIKGYSITSEAGALNHSNWKTIAGNSDVNGNGSVDSDDDWTKLSAPTSASDLSEFEFGGNGGTIAPSASVVLNVPAGNAWLKNPTEDLKLEVVLGDGRISQFTVEYINGPAGGFAVGDLNFDGSITALDWPIYNAGRGVDLSGMSAAQAYQLGDLDGDLDNDFMDFLQFKDLFTAANGAGSFAALVSVPEPTSALLLLLGSVSLLALRPKQAADFLSRRSPRSSVVISRCAVLCGSLLVLLCLAGTTRATTLNFNFNQSGSVPANNSDLNPTYGSNVTAGNIIGATAGAEGFTPNIGLLWAPAGGPEVDGTPDANVLEFHSAATFQGAGFTVPVLQFDVDLSQHTNPPDDPTIDFTVTGGFAFKLHSFKIGNATDQTEPPYRWNISLTRLSDMAVVATQTTGFLSAGSLETVNFNFTGDPNESYRLRFDDEGANAVRTGIDDLTFSQELIAQPQMKLIVNTLNGAVTLANSSGSSFNIDTYEIRSASSSLNATGWSSLQDQDFEGNGAPGTGNGWEEAGGVGAHQLIESYLFGSSTISNGASVFLGQAFDHDKVGVQQDLEFLYHEVGSGGILRTGIVEYVSVALAGDYNNNGVVDAADYTLWRKNLGAPNESGINNNGDGGGVTLSDFTFWKSRFGNISIAGSGSAGVASVPEPSTLGLFALLLVGLVPSYRRSAAGRLATGRGVVHVLAGVTAVFMLAQVTTAAVTVDRFYRFGEHASEPASAGAVVGSSLGETLDSVSQTGNRFDDDAQNLTPNSTTLGPKYINVGPTGLNRPGALAGQFGAQFDGVDDHLVGVPLNRPDETAGPDFVGDGPFLFPFPFNYNTITARGLQMWVYPDAAAIGTQRQGIVFDTIAAGGVSITADGKWTQTNDSRLNDASIPATVPVVGNQWHHVMQHIYPTTQPGAPAVLAGTGASDLGFTSVVFVNGVAVSANNGNPSPGELNNLDRIGVLAVGAEEVASLDTVNPAFANHFKGVVDDLKMYVFGDNSSDPFSPPGQNFGTFSLFADNDWIASQIALIPGGILQPGDINRDGSVNQADVTAFAAGWKKEKRLKGSINSVTVGDWETWGWGDLNLDGIVDLLDAVILDAQLNAGSGSGLASNVGVPEPTTLMLTGLGLLALACRRQRKSAAWQ